MDLLLSRAAVQPGVELLVPGSKSETNRLLLLEALYPEITIANASESDDSAVMQAALSSAHNVVAVHHAGTAMRFLTAYFAQQPGREVLLTGSDRMKERPIAILVEALRELGADIAFAEKEGYPPLYIRGKELAGGVVTLRADVSSQYITALLLIAPKMKQGLQLEITGAITSRPYIQMTLSLLEALGVSARFSGNCISVSPSPVIAAHHFVVESDWSAASYWYAITALSTVGTSISLSSFKEQSLQGDAALAVIYKKLGVETSFVGDTIVLQKTAVDTPQVLQFNLNDTPDIAQTLAVTCLGLGTGCTLTGLHTLTIKETDRLAALKAELEKFGAGVSITTHSLTLEPHTGLAPTAKPVAVATYNDHRMAMAFAPLALKVPLAIKDAGVVSKSYTEFWEHLALAGFSISEC